MASVFLATAPYSMQARYGRLAPIGATLPCLGLIILGAVLRHAGHRVRVVDASAQGLDFGKTLDALKEFGPDVVGLSAVTPSIVQTDALASKIKNLYPSIPIVLGGPHLTAAPRRTLTEYVAFDFGVVGEGEQTAVELIESLSAGRTPSKIPGVVFRENEKIHFAPDRDPIRDLDTLPLPAWDLLDGFPSCYRPAAFKYKKLPSTHIVSARGCPNRCVFCDTSVFGRKIRFHSPEYVLEMIDYLVTRFGIKEIIFEDDQFLVKKDRVAQICEGFLKADWNLSWCCSGRVNVVNDLSLLRLMKRSGCWQISYGIESGDQKILDAAKKAITIHQIQQAVQLTHKAGMMSKGFFIFGLPQETERTMAKTIGFAKSLPLDDISVFMMTPFPGSPIYETAKQHGALDINLEEMNLLNAVYVPNGLSKQKLLDYQRRFMKEFYLRPRIIGKYFRRLAENPLNMFNVLKASCGFLRHVFMSSS